MVVDYYAKGLSGEMLITDAYKEATRAYNDAKDKESIAAYGDILTKLERRMAHLFMLKHNYRYDITTNNYFKKLRVDAVE